MATMVPHSRRRRIQQSANILGDHCVHQCWEWGTMTDAVGHLSHDVLTDVVGMLWVVSHIGICRVVYQAISNTLLTRWQWASSSASEPSVQQPPHQIGCCVALSGQQHHLGLMRGGSGSKIEGRRGGGDDSYNRQVCTSINHGGRRCPTATMGPHSQLLSIRQSANILCDRTMLLKLGKNIINNVY